MQDKKQPFNLHENPEVRLIFLHIWQTWKLKNWEIQKLAEDHTANKW